MAFDKPGIIGHITFTYPVFPDNTVPIGLIPKDKEAQALFYYYYLAERQRQNVGKGPETQIIVVETGRENDVHWMDTHYSATFQTVALIYQVDPNKMLNYWPAVIRECERIGWEKPHPDYMNPKRWLTQ